MDLFEKHIRDHRDELDRIEKPDANNIWDGIQKGMQPEPPPKQPNWYRRLLWGAIILALGWSIGYFLQPKAEVEPEVEAIEAPRALLEQEQNYQLMVRQKMEALNFEAIDREEYKEIFDELELLEHIQLESRNDIPSHGYQEKLIQTLMRYYERKIRILEILSKEIEKKEHHEKRHHEQSI